MSALLRNRPGPEPFVRSACRTKCSTTSRPQPFSVSSPASPHWKSPTAAPSADIDPRSVELPCQEYVSAAVFHMALATSSERPETLSAGTERPVHQKRVRREAYLAQLLRIHRKLRYMPRVGVCCHGCRNRASLCHFRPCRCRRDTEQHSTGATPIGGVPGHGGPLENALHDLARSARECAQPLLTRISRRLLTGCSPSVCRRYSRPYTSRCSSMTRSLGGFWPSWSFSCMRWKRSCASRT
jgi:hypothetical protein